MTPDARPAPPAPPAPQAGCPLPPGVPPLRDRALRWLAEGRAAVVVEVLRARGSVPREAGTRMLVAADALHGTIGGGHLEQLAIDEARAGLAHGRAAWQDRDVPLGPALGQCCGGAVTLRWQRLDAAALADWPDEPPRFHLQLHGAGHVAQALVRLLATLPCRVQWVDARDDVFDPLGPLPWQVQAVVDDDPVARVAEAPPGALALVMTHSHALDLALCQALLARDDLPWIGLIGSATKRARFEHRLAARGLGPALAARLHCPIGVPGIAGKAPEVIALAVAAQLLQRAG